MKPPLTPHGPGFSFLDEADFDAAAGMLNARKRLDPALPVFADHFPGKPLFPAVLLAEAGAQAAGVLWRRLRGGGTPRPFVLAEIGKFRVRRPALPGQVLAITAKLEREFGTLAVFAVEVSVEGTLIAAGSLTLAEAPQEF